MASLEEILLRIAGESSSAQEAIDDIRKKVRDLPAHTELQIEAEVTKAKQEIEAIRRSLESIDKEKYEAEIRAEIASALARVEKFKKTLDGLPDKTVIDIDIRRQRIEAQIQKVSNQIRELEQRDPQIELDAKIEETEAKLARVRQQIIALDKQKSTPEVRLKIEEAVARSKQLKAQLEELGRQNPQIAIDDNIAVLQARLAGLHHQLNSLGDGSDSMRSSILSALAGVEKGVVGLGRGLKETEEASGRFKSNVMRAFFLIKGITPFVAGAALILGTALVPALIAAVGAFAAAAGGAISFASALSGSLIPAAIVGAQVISRFGKVMEAFKAQQAESDARALDAAKSVSGMTEAEQRRIQTLRQVSDAERSVERASRGVADARSQAAESIDDANRRVRDAQQAVADSARQVSDATVDAYRAMEDAAEAVTDAVRDLAEAELSLDRANLGVRQAQQDLEDFKDGIGAAGKEWEKAFKKFTDVEIDFDVVGLDKLLAATGVGDERDALELEDKILRVREAKQREKEATDGLSDAERDLSRRREENNKYLREGIQAYGPLRSAIEGAAAAQQTLADATREANELNKAGIDNAPGVIAAVEAEADARRNLARIRKDAKNQGDGASAVATAAARAEAAVNKLTDSEKRLLEQLKITQAFMDGALRKTTDAVFGGFSALLAGLPALVIPLTDNFEALGDALGRLGQNLGITLASPDVVSNISALTDMLADMVGVMADGAVGDFLRVMLIVGTQAAPLLVEMFKELAGNLRDLSLEAQGGGLNTFVANGIDGFRSLMSVLGAVLHLFRSVVETIGPFGADLARDMGKGIKAISTWLRSAEGQKDVGRFFKDTLPFVRQLVKVIFRLGRIFLKSLQFMAPFLKGFLDAFDMLLWAVEKFLDLLNDVASNPVGRFIREFIGAFFGFNVVLRIIGGVGKAISSIPLAFPAIRRFVRGTIQRFKDLGAGVFAAMESAAKTVGKWPGKVIDAISRGFNSAKDTVTRIGGNIVEKIGTGVTKAAHEALWYGRWIVFRIREGISKVAQRVWNGPVGDLLRKVAGAFDDAAYIVYKVGKDLLDGLIRGFVSLSSKAINEIEGLANSIIAVVKRTLKIQSPSRVFYDIGRNIVEGLVGGIADNKKKVEQAVRNMGADGIAAFGSQISGKNYHFWGDGRGGRPKRDLLDPKGWVERQGGPVGVGKLIPFLAKDAIKDKILGDLIGDVIGLARGGLVTGPTLAQIGEGVHQEAVLPLSKSVMRSLAQAITTEMAGLRMAPALAGMGMGSAAPIYKIDKIVVQTPSGDVPDGRAAAVLLGRELERRGGG